MIDAQLAIEAGADMLGFNFYPPSPRSISPNQCAEITSILYKTFPKIVLVGVFVNMPVEEIKNILQICHLNLVQLHGDETPEILGHFNNQAFKAFRGIPSSDLINQYTTFNSKSKPTFLIDANTQGIFGGSGNTVDWDSASELSRKFPILLAGGLNPTNVSEAVKKVMPWGVDVASGIEITPGKKDPEKMKIFVDAVKSVQLQNLGSKS